VHGRLLPAYVKVVIKDVSCAWQVVACVCEGRHQGCELCMAGCCLRM